MAQKWLRTTPLQSFFLTFSLSTCTWGRSVRNETQFDLTPELQLSAADNSSFISWLEDTLLGCPSVSSWGDLSFAGFGITGPREGATPWKRHAGLSRVNGLWNQWQRNLYHFPWFLVLEEQVLLPLGRSWLGGPFRGLFLTPDALKQVNNLIPFDCCWVVFNLHTSPSPFCFLIDYLST